MIRASETQDDYPHVVCKLDSKRRVIACSDGIQWAIQRRKGKQWRGEYYFRTKAGLLAYANSDARELHDLPERFPEHRRPLSTT